MQGHKPKFTGHRVHSLESLPLPSLPVSSLQLPEHQTWCEGGVEVWMSVHSPKGNVFVETFCPGVHPLLTPILSYLRVGVYLSLRSLLQNLQAS